MIKWIKKRRENKRIEKEKADKERRERWAKEKEQQALAYQQKILDKIKGIKHESDNDIWRALALTLIEIGGYIDGHENEHSYINRHIH